MLKKSMYVHFVCKYFSEGLKGHTSTAHSNYSPERGLGRGKGGLKGFTQSISILAFMYYMCL